MNTSIDQESTLDAAAPPGKLIGLTSRTSGLPFVIWLRRAGLKKTPHLETTSALVYDADRTTYTIDPLMRIRGPSSWTELSLLGVFLQDNLRTLLNFWNGEYDDGKEVISKIVKADPEIVSIHQRIGQEILAWKEDCEILFQKTGKIEQAYRGMREPARDHPEPD